ncbi:MAG TPA: phosphate signaling complex protein PhoU [Polyangia bacterium]|jgi:phosphate transport system protein|nr:phosphate signaling complex protein PhoU [Polyangia bacterium]
METRGHTSRDFEAELTDVRDRLVAMGTQVDGVLEASGRALVARDIPLAKLIILTDRKTDSMELEIDHRCLDVLARRQPVAGDLRLLTSALKMVVDLERVGDLGVSIAARVVELGREPPVIPYDDLLTMLTAARQMVPQALASLVAQDVARANQVIANDDVVDAQYARIFQEIVEGMRQQDPPTIARAMRVQAIAKYVERIGDHATNIAERVIFVLTGNQVRHQGRVRRTDLSQPRED